MKLKAITPDGWTPPKVYKVSGIWHDDYVVPAVWARVEREFQGYDMTEAEARRRFRAAYSWIGGSRTVLRGVHLIESERVYPPEGIHTREDWDTWDRIHRWSEDEFATRDTEVYDLVQSLRNRFGGKIDGGSSRVTVVSDEYVYKVPMTMRGLEDTIREDEWDPAEWNGAPLAPAEIIERHDFDGFEIPVLRMEKVVKRWDGRDPNTGALIEYPEWHKKQGFDGFQGGWLKSGELVLYDP